MLETKFHTHTEVTGKIMDVYILIFTFLGSKREGRRFWTEWWQALPEFSFFLISS
jgi:hypothetical protein